MKSSGLKGTTGLVAIFCLALALTGCHGNGDEDAGADSSPDTTEHHATPPESNDSASAPQQTPPEKETPPESQPQHNGLTAADCTRSQWKRVNCTNKSDSCIEQQIDQMGKYERCRKAGLLEK